MSGCTFKKKYTIDSGIEVVLCLTSPLDNLASTIKLGFKKRLDKEQIGNSEPFPVTNLLVYLINSEQIGISEQFCDDQKAS